MKIILALALLLALFGVLGLCAWGTTTAATSLALAGGIALNQVTTMALAFALVTLVGLMPFVAVKMFGLGRMLERRRADEELDQIQHALDRAPALTSRTIAPVLSATPSVLIAPPHPQAQIDPPHVAPRRLAKRGPRVRRAALKVAKRWFS